MLLVIMNKFKPSIYKKSIFDINYDLLKNKKIKVIAFDLDNTIVPYDEKEPNKEVIALVKKLKKDFIVVVTSNNFHGRVKYVSDILDCDFLCNLLKPSKKLKKLIINKYQVKMQEVCIIGDQLITDIFLGNRLGMTTILVDPIKDKDFKITFFNRFLEKRIIKKINLRKGNYYE